MSYEHAIPHSFPDGTSLRCTMFSMEGDPLPGVITLSFFGSGGLFIESRDYGLFKFSKLNVLDRLIGPSPPSVADIVRETDADVLPARQLTGGTPESYSFYVEEIVGDGIFPSSVGLARADHFTNKSRRTHLGDYRPYRTTRKPNQ